MIPRAHVVKITSGTLCDCLRGVTADKTYFFFEEK